MAEDEHLLDQAIDLYLTGLKGLGSFISEPSAAFSLSFEQYLILRSIVHQPGVKLMDIAKERGVTRSAVSRQLKVLLTNHYVIQKKDPADRRRQSLVATPEGKKVEGQIAQRVKKRFSNWLTIFGTERGAKLLDLLSAFNQQIVQANKEKDESK
ncbi:MarR family winged helix-turn-helix transcriptional regulator [Limosilactobacillus avium]|uniref:MarR family winged helix-turn-helix transcriptional regulator n=1 Tax=Limosilactobacillus avium TaxID=2991831 RepID=UPI0024BA6E88|nr:MarR family winged helix-turn-helix transcriptional regulator [Limosilactobacillus avium]